MSRLQPIITTVQFTVLCLLSVSLSAKVDVHQITNGFFFAGRPYEFTRPIYPEVEGLMAGVASDSVYLTTNNCDAVTHTLGLGAAYSGSLHVHYQAFSNPSPRHEDLLWLAEVGGERYATWSTVFANYREFKIDEQVKKSFENLLAPSRPRVYFDPYESNYEVFSNAIDAVEFDYGLMYAPPIFTEDCSSLFSLMASGQTDLGKETTRLSVDMPVEAYYSDHLFTPIMKSWGDLDRALSELPQTASSVVGTIRATPFRPDLSNFLGNIQRYVEDASHALSHLTNSFDEVLTSATNNSALAESFFDKATDGTTVTNVLYHSAAMRYAGFAEDDWNRMYDICHAFQTNLGQLAFGSRYGRKARDEIKGYLFSIDDPLRYTRSPSYFCNAFSTSNLIELCSFSTNFFSYIDQDDIARPGGLNHVDASTYESCTNLNMFLEALNISTNIELLLPKHPVIGSAVSRHDVVDRLAGELSEMPERVSVIVPLEQLADTMHTQGELKILSYDTYSQNVNNVSTYANTPDKPSDPIIVENTWYERNPDHPEYTFTVYGTRDVEEYYVTTNYSTLLETASPTNPISFYKGLLTSINQYETRGTVWSRTEWVRPFCSLKDEFGNPYVTVQKREYRTTRCVIGGDSRIDNPGFEMLSYSAMALGKPLRVHSPVVLYLEGDYYCRLNEYHLPVSRGCGIDGTIETPYNSGISKFVTALCDVEFNFSVYYAGWNDWNENHSHSNHSYSAYSRRAVVPVKLRATSDFTGHDRFWISLDDIRKQCEDALFYYLCDSISEFSFNDSDGFHVPPYMDDTGSLINTEWFKAERSRTLTYSIRDISIAVDINFTQGTGSQKDSVYHVPGYKDLPVPPPITIGVSENGWTIKKSADEAKAWANTEYMKGAANVGNVIQRDLYLYEKRRSNPELFFDYLDQ